MKKNLFFYLVITYAIAFALSPSSAFEVHREGEVVTLSQLWKR